MSIMSGSDRGKNVAEVNISFRGKDFRQLADALDRRVPNKITEALSEILDRILYSVELKAKQYVPVRTGHLKSTIQSVKFEEKVGAVMALADYAGFVEYGTRYMNAHPYLRSAWFNTLPEIYALFRLVLPEKISEGLQ